MSPAEVHTVTLYGGVTAALIAMAATLRHRGEWTQPPLRVLMTILPYVVIAVLESLALRANGKLLVEWLVPGLAALVVTIGSRNRRVVFWARWFLLLLAVALWLHGNTLLASDYVTRPVGVAPGVKLVDQWYTPLTGLRRRYRD
jgi:hypothetical protein